ncbi:MAG: FAD-dependent oxidoreductase [Leptospiraceae bacterium]|nr:FAD-dependent oxidoreductase [Leptospiraceae bacterium]
MKKLAIIGSGISGMGTAWLLRDKYDITVFEKNNYAGGHTNTVTVNDEGGDLPIDTGFIVFNDVTYPTLIRTFAELNVTVENSDMSFAVHSLDSGLQFNGSSLNGLFAQRKNIFKPSYLKFLLAINRFNKTAPRHLESNQANMRLAEYVTKYNYPDSFMQDFLVPMASAVWSTPIEKMADFPTATLIRFFLNHGFLGLDTQYQWKTVTGGSINYMNKIRAALKKDVIINTPVKKIVRKNEGVTIVTQEGEQHFDLAVCAVHGDQVLPLLENPTPLEKELISPFRYEKNIAILHTDESVMPPLKKVWSAWNYIKQGNLSTTAYWMNKLQNLKTRNNYFVSINEFRKIDTSKIIRTIEYEHPLFDRATEEAQKRLHELNASGPLYFAGAWTRYGFHEDGMLSADNVAKRLL